MRDIRAGNIVGLFFWRTESRRDAAPTAGNDEEARPRGETPLREMMEARPRGDVLYKTYACW